MPEQSDNRRPKKSGARHRARKRAVDLLFEAADVLHPAFIKIGSEQGSRTTDLSELVAPLRDIAEEAIAHGTRIAIEPMPFSIIDSIPAAAELIRAAGHPAAGLLIDAWHVFRAGTTIGDLARSLTPEMIFGVELDEDVRAHLTDG